MATKRSEYKGAALIELHRSEEANDQWPFSFGLSKAKLIVANFDEIKKFVEEQEKKSPTK